MAETNTEDPVILRRVGIIAIGAVGVLYILAAVITGVPIAHATALMALIMVVSAFVPVKPLDGSRLELHNWVNWGFTAAMVGVTVLFALKVL